MFRYMALKASAIIVFVFLLTAWTHGNSGVAVNLLDNSSVILTTDTGINLIE